MIKSQPICLPCCLKQALVIAQEVTADKAQHMEVLREAMAALEDFSLDISPAENSTYAVWAAHRALKNEDPFKEKKRFYNSLALKMYPSLRQIVERAENPLDASVRVAGAGNVIDLGIMGNDVDIEKAISDIFNWGFAVNHLEDLEEALLEARNVLYLGDNAGEIVFDKVLVEELVRLDKEVTFVVREVPAMNDILMEDALAVGMDKVARVISNGSTMFGAHLPSCSEEFLRAFHAADLIIAKGQANIETLYGEKDNIFFILKAKCEIMAQNLGVKFGDMVLLHMARAMTAGREER
ncbi:MAG: damage-control phosphatase ARMT1 family protein [Anaerolineae bacterium]